MARTVFKIAEAVARRLVGSIPTRSRHDFQKVCDVVSLNGDVAVGQKSALNQMCLPRSQARSKMPATYDDLSIDESFPRNYEVDWLVDMPNSPSLEKHVLSASPPGVGSGPILMVTSEGVRFVAVVGGERGNLRVVTWPNAWCFLALPSAILVNAREPNVSGQLEGFDGHSVHYAVPLAERGLILVGHCCAIYCYASEGLLWSIEDAFCCVDPIIDVAGEDLILIAHKHLVDPGETPTRKTFDLLTGTPR